jgi:hypothetical protein
VGLAVGEARPHVEPAAVKEDVQAVCREGTKATGSMPYGLDFAVESFGHGVGDRMREVSEQSAQVILKGASDGPVASRTAPAIAFHVPRMRPEIPQHRGIVESQILDARIKRLPRRFPRGECLADDLRVRNATPLARRATSTKRLFGKFDGHHSHDTKAIPICTSVDRTKLARAPSSSGSTLRDPSSQFIFSTFDRQPTAEAPWLFTPWDLKIAVRDGEP